MSRTAPSLEGRSADIFFQRIKKQMHRGQGSSSTRESFAVDNLEFIEEIGRGGYGRVDAAKYSCDIVAVKQLHSLTGTRGACSSEPQNEKDALAKEAEILEKKRSRHIVSLFHYCPDRKLLVMEYCKNGSLHDVMHDPSKRHIVVEWKNRLKWTWQIAQAMTVMHNGSPSVALHRDMRPENLFLTEYYNIRVGDVGLSKESLTDFDRSTTGSMDGHCTVWQPPEVMTEQRYSTKSDVYSFGVIMHQLLMIEGPYGFDLPPQELNLRVRDHVTSGQGLPVPADRQLIPGRWHDCLKKYIKLMKRCCATKPEGRPEFNEICETLDGIQNEYRNAKWPQSASKRFSAESLKRVFVASVMVIFCLLSGSVLLEHSGPAWITEEGAFNDTPLLMQFVCIFFGLFCFFGYALCVAMQPRGIYKFLKKRVFKAVKSSFMKWSEWFQEWKLRQEGQDDLSSKSPFAVGPSSPGFGCIASDGNVVHLPIPDPEIWNEIRKAFISELRQKADYGLQAILGFCEEHENGQLEQSDWEAFLRLSVRESKVTSTDTWRRYQRHLTIPMFYGDGVASTQECMPPLDDEHVSAGGMNQASDSRFERVRTGSFSFDLGEQLEAEQLSDCDLLPKSFSRGHPATGNHSSEI